MENQASIRPRLFSAAFYVWIFGGLGSVLPFLPVVLDQRSFSARQIAWALILMPICDMAVPPVWGIVSDLLRSRRGALVIAAAGASATVLLLIGATTFMTVGAAIIAFCVFRSALVPLGDASTRAMLGADGRNYAWIRVWGSISFGVVASVIGSLSAQPIWIFGAASIMYGLASLTSLGLSSADITEPPATAVQGSFMERALRVIVDRPFAIFLVATSIYYAGFSLYDAFFSLHVLEVGLERRWLGVVWSIGVAAEVAVLFLTPLLLRRWRAGWLLAFAALSAVARWSILAVSGNLAVILGSQVLHGLSFGLWYAAAVEFAQSRAHPELRATVQALMIASIGSGRVLGYLVGGELYDTLQGSVFGISAGFASVAFFVYFYIRDK